MAAEHGVTVEHVKLADTADAVARVVAEKAAGRAEGGSIDLIWINGENFAAMKRQDLLFGPFAERLPNYALVDVEGKPTDHAGLHGAGRRVGECPGAWPSSCSSTTAPSCPTRRARSPRCSIGRRTTRGASPTPSRPTSSGSTFLKQALIELIEQPEVLQSPAEQAAFAAATAPLWDYLDQLHPLLWRHGKLFPSNGPDQRQLLDAGEARHRGEL